MPVRVSVAMATWDGERYLREQLESIAGQTRPPDELIVVDDASTDSTPSILEAFAASAPFDVRVHRSERNTGSLRAFGRALAACTGDVVALADQDDVWEPDKLAVLLEAQERTGASLVFSDAVVVDEAGAPTGTTLWRSFGVDGGLSAGEGGRAPALQFHRLARGNVVTGATALVARPVVDVALPIPPCGPPVHDWWLALVAAAVGEVVAVERPLVRYRRHHRQQIGPGAGAPPERYGVLSRATLPTDVEAEAARVECLAARLAERAGAGARGARAAQDLAAHLRHRADLPGGALSPARVAAVVREAWSGRYRRFSNGSATVAKDLVRPAARRTDVR